MSHHHVYSGKRRGQRCLLKPCTGLIRDRQSSECEDRHVIFLAERDSGFAGGVRVWERSDETAHAVKAEEFMRRIAGLDQSISIEREPVANLHLESHVLVVAVRDEPERKRSRKLYLLAIKEWREMTGIGGDAPSGQLKAKHEGRRKSVLYAADQVLAWRAMPSTNPGC